ncbi:MAG: protein kinase [Sandaracinaceae bacterium]
MSGTIDGGIQTLLAGTRRGLGSLQIVMATGLYKTAAGVVGQKVFKEHAEALRTYLTIHLRSTAAAQNALTSIEDAMQHGSREEWELGPSKRAALFLSARNMVEYERLFGEMLAPMSSVPWEPTPPGRPEGWSRALDELRFSLGEDEAEILSFAHAFGLSLADIGYVLGLSKSEVKRRLDAGFGYAKLLLEDIFADDVPDLESLIGDAFRVVPPSQEEIAASKPRAVPLPAGTLLGDRYEIQATIGGGEFAFVYRARDVRVPGHIVALKLLHRVARTPAAREGAIRELSLIASAFHPSLVQFKDHGWFEERLWFVMPFYTGELLLDRLEKGSLAIDDALQHFERLARGLAALHAAGIRHQDIKPENIFLVELATGADRETPEVLPILLDLGVASPSGEMALAGTPMYFAPEVAGHIFDDACALPLTPKADVFALVLSLLHSVEVPDLSEFENVDVDAFLRKRQRFAPSGPNSDALAHLRPSFRRWLAPDPADRPSAGELADEIAALRRDDGEVPSPSLNTGRAGWRLAAAAAFGVLVTGAAVAGAMGGGLLSPSAGETVATTPEAPASDREQMLRHQVTVEQQRALELEEELERLRRLELGISPEEQALLPDAAVPSQDDDSPG